MLCFCVLGFVFVFCAIIFVRVCFARLLFCVVVLCARLRFVCLFVLCLNVVVLCARICVFGSVCMRSFSVFGCLLVSLIASLFVCVVWSCCCRFCVRVFVLV